MKAETRSFAARIHEGEWSFVILMFSYFFAVITTFWILKPIKKALFIDYYKIGGHHFDLFGWQLSGPQAEMIAKVGNMVVVFFAALVFTWLANTLRRQQLTYVFAAFCLVVLLMYRALLPDAGELTVWSFYIFGDLYNSLMVATFFAFLNDSVSPLDARRLYGPIILGGVTGGAFSSFFVRTQIENFEPSDWALICAGIMVLIAVLAGAAGGWVTRRGEPTVSESPALEEKKKRSSVAFKGARLVLRSRYLLAIVGLVGIYEIVSQLVNYQFTATVVHYVKGSTGSHFATVFAITNIVALLVQVFVTTNVMSRFGVKAALLVMPVLILGASGLFLLLPILWIGSSLSTIDNGLNYSINQSARESLYTPLSREEKYKAKAFIDMFLYRAGKVIAIGVALLLSVCVGEEFTVVRLLSFLTIALVAAWVGIASFAGNRFRAMTENE
jgi:AAA family ATP:ADP antiporter